MIPKNASFSSKRLEYRGIAIDDAEKIVSWRSDPDIYQHLFRGKELSLEEHLAWFQRYLDDPTRVDFMILDEEGHRIGTVSLTDIEGNACEIGYLIGDKAKRGRGYAKEAILAVTEFAFDMGVESIYARILPQNEASKRTAIASGFEEERSVFCLRKSV